MQEKAANNIYGRYNQNIHDYVIRRRRYNSAKLPKCSCYGALLAPSAGVQQVIGRARRICSHEDLPPDEQVVRVFMYLMTFSKEQIKDQLSTEFAVERQKYFRQKMQP